MNNQLISIIVPVYNAERTLERTLFCIANQTYQNLEILLIDDGSTDSSGQLCDTFAKKDPRCKVIHQPNGGQGSAKNAGQRVAKGDFLFFPDSDDTFNLDLVRLLAEALSKDPAYDLALCGFKMVENWDSDTTPLQSQGMTEYSRDDLIEGLFCQYDDRFVYGWNKLYRKELLDHLWCRDYPRHQDFDFNLRVFLRTNKAVFVNQELYHWVQWSGSKTHQPNTRDLYYRSRTEILYDNWGCLSSENEKYSHFLLDALYKVMVFWEEWSRKSGNFPEVKTLCDDYRKKTTMAYVKNKGIRPVKKKACLMMLKFPSFAHFMMKLTHNAR